MLLHHIIILYLNYVCTYCMMYAQIKIFLLPANVSACSQNLKMMHDKVDHLTAVMPMYKT